MIRNSNFENYEKRNNALYYGALTDLANVNFLHDWLTFAQYSARLFYSNDNIKAHSGDAFIGMNDSTVFFQDISNRSFYAKKTSLSFFARSDGEFNSNFSLYIWLSDTLVSHVKHLFFAKPQYSFHISGRDLAKDWTGFRGQNLLNTNKKYMYCYFDEKAKIHQKKAYIFFDDFVFEEVEDLQLKVKAISNNIHFEGNETHFSSSSTVILDTLAATLLKHKDKKLKISVHSANNKEHTKFNEITEAQAIAIKAYLCKKGIADERIIAKGYGASKPIISTPNEKERLKNQRVELNLE
jgi:outer membrane protein OmpA-like peptidoglycan-associated protein